MRSRTWRGSKWTGCFIPKTYVISLGDEQGENRTTASFLAPTAVSESIGEPREELSDDVDGKARVGGSCSRLVSYRHLS